MPSSAKYSTPQAPSAQAAYSELMEVTRHQELSRSVENLSGSFNKKTVKGSTYWYYQYTEGSGTLRQIFIGKDDEKLQALVARAKTKDASQLDQLAKGAIALGCSATTPAHFRIVRRLNEIGFFGAGGVLVGTHAFLAYGNMLGVSWGDLARTQDIDFAHAGSNIQLALPTSLTIETRSAIESLESGFLPAMGFRPWDPTSTFINKRDKQLRIDFLAPMVGGKEKVFAHHQLGVNLQPLRFLEFVLEDIDQAAIISAVGSVMANVPDPARYALHKMLVHVERRVRNPTKARKDLAQSAALIEALTEFRAEGLLVLWKDLLARGPGWRERARKALVALERESPDLEMLAPMKAATK